MIDENTKIILGTARFKGGINVDGFLNVPLKQSTKLLNEYDRSIDVNLEDLFDEERQQSTIFRPVAKYTILFENAISGKTTYTSFRDNLYYTNELANTITAFPNGNLGPLVVVPTNPSPWEGLPQYFEFDFIRQDFGVTGYTSPPNNHVDFKSISANTYNWTHYLSYPYENDYNKTLFAIQPRTNFTWTWVVSQGIPFYITVGSDQFTRVIKFRCPVPHGLQATEYVELSINYKGEKYFQVSSLGDPGYGSNEFIFSIPNIGFTGNTFQTGAQGFLKRVINVNNISETRSEYYIRKHKIITDVQCSVLTYAGFEQLSFNDTSKIEKAALTPTQVERVSIKESNRSYSLSFNCDVDINTYRDNQKRPITQLFFTTLWRGYFGWTKNMKQGWFFNTYTNNGLPSSWWDQSNPLSNTNITQLQYNSLNNQGPFYYNKTLTSGDTMDGDFCEWNNWTQEERVVSNYVHKIKFNQTWFSQPAPPIPTNTFGYFYNPHNVIQLREYSTYIEESESDNIVDLPDYAVFSQLSNTFRWRDIYPYGFFDTDFVGVDYPFTNGKHYPFTDLVFRITPENYNIPSEYSEGILPPNITTITDPLIDECE